MKLWKALGLAGLAGVAATGVIIARNERRRAQIGPDEVRERLRQRLEAAGGQPSEVPPPPRPAAGWRRWGRRRNAGRHVG